jgi:uncharacterized protein YlxW (UPF0749 family)
MKINFTEEEKFKINLFIQRYHSVNVEVDSLKKKAEDIKKRIEDEQLKLKEIKKEEDEFMNELHKKYGKFSIQAVSNNI